MLLTYLPTVEVGAVTGSDEVILGQKWPLSGNYLGSSLFLQHKLYLSIDWTRFGRCKNDVFGEKTKQR